MKKSSILFPGIITVHHEIKLKNQIKYIFKRTRLYDEKHFEEDLKNIDWDKIRSSSDVNEKAAKLEEAINDKHFKIKKVKVRKCFRSGLSKESKDL